MVCKCIWCKYSDKPEILKDIATYLLDDKKMTLAVLKANKVKCGELGGDNQKLSTLRAVLECEIEELNEYIGALNNGRT